MKSLTIKLPDRVIQELRLLAGESGISLEDFSTDILVNHVFSSREAAQAARGDGATPRKKEVLRPPKPTLQIESKRVGSWQSAEPSTKQEKPFFSVEREFGDRDSVTIQQTQKFVDTALEYEGVSAFKKDDEIGFDPNFVYIERVYSKEVGFAASFYGNPAAFAEYQIQMEPGRGSSYSRYKVKSWEDLDTALKALHISAHLKSLERTD